MKTGRILRFEYTITSKLAHHFKNGDNMKMINAIKFEKKNKFLIKINKIYEFKIIRLNNRRIRIKNNKN